MSPSQSKTQPGSRKPTYEAATKSRPSPGHTTQATRTWLGAADSRESGARPARVLARVIHEGGREYSLETSIAEKRGEETDPIRTPAEPIDREARYAQKQQQRDGIAAPPEQ